MASSPPARSQFNEARREAAGVERQFIRNGMTEQAERLRTQMGGLMPGVKAPVNASRLPLTSPNP